MQLGFNHKDTKALSQNDFLAIRLKFYSQSKLTPRARTQWSQPVYSWCLCAFVVKNLFPNCTIRVKILSSPAFFMPSPSFPETGGRGAIYRALAGTGRNELRPYEGRKYAVRKKLREGKPPFSLSPILIDSCSFSR